MHPYTQITLVYVVHLMVYCVLQHEAIRAQLNVSQSEMAQALGTSVDTIKSWETKRRNPTGLAAKVLAAI
ncbi:putative transcriptional regulator [Serratia quinivorans]|nr:putative transcriptional regulator [Serratia quinivorans]CAI1701173.1 putative transcriptional regulator [Serratia quinivorans]